MTRQKPGTLVRKWYRSVDIDGRSRPAHIVIVERALGKPLPKGAIVHHFDGDIHNNSLSNLVVCPDQRYHWLLHRRQRVRAAGGDPNTQRICWMCEQPKFAHELVGRQLSERSNKCLECCRVESRNNRRKAALGLTADAPPQERP